MSFNYTTHTALQLSFLLLLIPSLIVGEF
uniref:Uncharacterized protein n=1 Tax=Anguilla anguilla TaxID=7936 RepID=A0A0E9QWC3_ANGAN